MNGDDHPATRAWDGAAPMAGLLALLARHLPPGLMVALDGPAPEGLLRHFPQARLVPLPDAIDRGAPAPIDLLLHAEDTALGDTQPALWARLPPGCVIITPLPAALRRSLAIAASRRFGPTRSGRLFAWEGWVILLPPAGTDPASDAMAEAMPGMGAAALPDATARFQIIIESLADRLAQGSDVMLHGVIYNRDAGMLDFDQAQHHPLRLAARLWRHGHPTTLAEPRAVLAPPALLPAGGRMRFALRLPTADLPQGDYRLCIDLVREGLHWFEDLGHPVLSMALEISPGLIPRAPRCTVIGMADSATGLGVNLRMTTQALRRIGIQPVLRDLGQGLPEVPLPPLPAATAEVMMQRDVVIIHINADQAPQILAHPAGGGRSGSYRIGFFLWEMEVLPQSHRLALDLLDEIWVPSAYLARVYAAAFEKPVINMRKGITLPATIPPLPRARYGIEAAAFCFLCSFDFHSAVERKNPMAAVQAFQLAFPPGDDSVRLVIKSTEFVADHWGDPHGQWQALQAACLADSRIHLIVEAMGFDDYLGLIACTDCVVSPHRAEGFGYLPAYAMLLGKPAIITDYSGTQEYCDETTAFPVRATLRPVQPVEAYYQMEGAYWAEVDVPHMAERMREVLADPAAAQRRAAAGRTRLQQEFSEAALAARYADRLRALGAIERDW